MIEQIIERIREGILLVWDRLRQIPLRKTLRTGAMVFGIAMIALWLSFPLDAVLEMAKRSMGGSAARVDFTDAGMGLTGPSIDGLRLRHEHGEIQFDHVVLRPKLSTLWLSPGISVHAARGEGTLDFSTGFIPPYDVSLEIDNLSLAQTGIGRGLPLGLNLGGTLSGQGDFTWSDKRTEITGAVELAIEPALLSGNAMPLPSTNVSFKAIKFKASAKAGLVSIEPLSLDGQDIWGNARGTIELYSTLPRSMADLNIRLHFSDPIAQSLGPLLPMAGFRPERESYVKNFKGPLYKLKGG